MSAIATERAPSGLAEYPNLAPAVFNPRSELARINIIAQHVDLAIPVVFEPKGPRGTVAVGDQVRGRDDDVTFCFVFPAEQMAIRSTDQQMTIVAHVTVP